MDSGFYAACAALMARSQALDLVANNLANTSTPGYRAQHNIFRSFLATASGHPGSGLNQAVNDFGISGGSQMDLTQGNLEHTGNDLDFAVQGPGFFEVKTATGLAFTRNGNFQVSAKGQLTTAQGDPVMGEQGPIRIVGGPVTVSRGWHDFGEAARSREKSSWWNFLRARRSRASARPTTALPRKARRRQSNPPSRRARWKVRT